MMIIRKEFQNALWKGQHNKIEQLILQGADINADPDGWPPLILIASKDKIRVKCLEVLIKYGADVNVQQKTDNNLPQLKTALMYAASNRHTAFDVCNEAVRCLVKHHAAIDQKDANGQSALMHAAKNGRIANARYLVQHGAEINRQDDQGRTPLMHAFINLGNLTSANKTNELTLLTIQSLIDLGTDISIQDNAGLDAVQLARKAGRHDIADFMKSYVASVAERSSLLTRIRPENAQDTPLFL